MPTCSRRAIVYVFAQCEGCEWRAFADVAVRAPWLLTRVCTLVVELHLAPRLGMNTSDDLRRMATFWDSLVLKAGFRFWYLHANPGPSHAHALKALRQPPLQQRAPTSTSVAGGHGAGGSGWVRPAAVHPLLAELGADVDTCCYEIGLYRNSC